MRRLSQIFLFFVVAAGTILAMFVHLAPVAYDTADTEALERQAMLSFELFLVGENVRSWERISEARFIAVQPVLTEAVGSWMGAAPRPIPYRATAENLEPGTADPETADAVDPSVIEALLPELAIRVRRANGRSSDLMVVVDVNGAPIASYAADPTADNTVAADLVSGREVAEAISRGISSDGLQFHDSHLYYTAAAPIVNWDRTRIGALLVAERLDSEALSEWSAGGLGDVLVFRDGTTLATTLESGELRSRIDSWLIRIATQPDDLLGPVGYPGSTTTFELEEDRVAFAVTGRLRDWISGHRSATLGFTVVLRQNHRPVEGLLDSVVTTDAFSSSQANIWTFVIVGIGVFVFGFFLIELTGRGRQVEAEPPAVASPAIPASYLVSLTRPTEEIPKRTRFDPQPMPMPQKTPESEPVPETFTTEPTTNSVQPDTSPPPSVTPEAELAPPEANSEQHAWPSSTWLEEPVSHWSPAPPQPQQVEVEADTLEIASELLDELQRPTDPDVHVQTPIDEPLESVETLVAPQPEEPPSFSPTADETLRQLFDSFVRFRRQCGERVDGLQFERFVEKIQHSEAALWQRYQCASVHFDVCVQDGRAAIKASPITEQPYR